MILSEEELVRRCIKNNRFAQDFLFNKFYQSTYLIAKRYLVDHHLTQDSVILAFTRAFKNLKSFKYQGPGSLGKWIRTIVINESLRILKKRSQLSFDEGFTSNPIEDFEPNGLQLLQAADIMLMIEQLPNGYRTVFNLYAIEGVQPSRNCRATWNQ